MAKEKPFTMCVWMLRDKQQWPAMRLILSRIGGSKGLPSTYEEWVSRNLEVKQQVEERGGTYEEVMMSPGWINQEMQSRRLPMTERSLVEILRNPLGDLKFPPGAYK